jgi:putrescine importer
VRHRSDRLNPFCYVVIPLIGAIIDIASLTQLANDALVLGLSWLAIGVVYLLVLTRGFTRQPPDLAGIADTD